MSKISVLSFGTCLRKAHYESLVQAYRILALNNTGIRTQLTPGLWKLQLRHNKGPCICNCGRSTFAGGRHTDAGNAVHTGRTQA